MLAVHGYYDGASFQALEEVMPKKNQRVIITIMDDFVDTSHNTDNERIKKIEQLCGSLAKYSNPNLREKEAGAWERAVVEKYGNL